MTIDMKKQKQADFSEEAEIFNLLAGIVDLFINDLEAIKSPDDKKQYEAYISNVRGMKNNLIQISEKLKKL
jgi:hypothetical protein